MNRKYFKEIYPANWHAGRKRRKSDKSLFRYQEITLGLLDCFPGCSLLELGCGSGELLERLIKKHNDIQLFGIDLGHESLIRAKNVSHYQNRLNLINGDINILPLSSGIFDRVLASSVMWYVPNSEAAISEMIRILKPGGCFVFDVRNPYHITNLLTIISIFIRRLLGSRKPHYNFYSPGSLNALLQKMPLEFKITGYFVLLPTRLPILGRKYGNWASLSEYLSYRAGFGKGVWLAQKLLISGHKKSTGI